MKKKVITFLVILGILLVIDFILGMLIVHKYLPRWIFLLANIPFGAVYVWTESLWVGSYYQLNGQAVRESVIGIAQMSSLGAQVIFYFVIWEIWSRKRRVFSHKLGEE